MSRLARPLHPLALSVAMAFAAVPLLTVQSSFAEESSSAERRFSIPAGDLSQALNSLAEQAGLVLAFDAGLTRGKRSKGQSAPALSRFRTRAAPSSWNGVCISS